MRKLEVTMFMSLDGVMEEPVWTAPYWKDEIAKFKLDELLASDALLLGRVTYQGFANAWPSRTDDIGFADRMNRLPKYVVSTTLENPTWNNSTLIKENVAGEIIKLKQQRGQAIMVAGSVKLIQTLLQENLIDEYRLLIYPVILGKGRRLFPEGSKTTLKLLEAKTFHSGVVLVRYAPL